MSVPAAVVRTADVVMIRSRQRARVKKPASPAAQRPVEDRRIPRVGERFRVPYVESGDDDTEGFIIPARALEFLRDIEPSANGVEIEITDDGLLIRPAELTIEELER